jgi:hypothetical protein
VLELRADELLPPLNALPPELERALDDDGLD